MIEAHFAPLVQLEALQALAANERTAAVRNHCPDVKTPSRQGRRDDLHAGFGDVAEHADVDTGSHPVEEQRDHPRIAQVRVVDQQLAPGRADERGQPVACVQRADEQSGTPGDGWREASASKSVSSS